MQVLALALRFSVVSVRGKNSRQFHHNADASQAATAPLPGGWETAEGRSLYMSP